MMMFVPEDRVYRSPQWWSSERYDYCDVIIKKANESNLFNRFFRKIAHLFA